MRGSGVRVPPPAPVFPALIRGPAPRSLARTDAAACLSRLPLPLLYALCGALAWLLRVAGWRRATRRRRPGALPAASASTGRAPPDRARLLRVARPAGGRDPARRPHARRRTRAAACASRTTTSCARRSPSGRRVLLVDGAPLQLGMAAAEVSRRFGAPLVAPYKPVSRASADRWMRDLRSRFGATMVPAKELGPATSSSSAAGCGCSPWSPTSRRRRRTSTRSGCRSSARTRRSSRARAGSAHDSVSSPSSSRCGRTAAAATSRASCRWSAPGERPDPSRSCSAYVRALEPQIREHPAQYFWAYNRWKRAKRRHD